MNNLFTSSLTIDKKYFPFLFIVTFVFINAFYNSLASAYGYNHFPFNTFLYYEKDLHADLIKMAVGYIPDYIHLDTTSWNPIYRNYYYLHFQGFFNVHHFNNAHMPPLSFTLGWLISKLLIATSPTVVITVYYGIVFAFIAGIALYFKRNRFDFWVLFITLSMSYPILYVLTRGNIFAFLNAMALMTFLYLIVQKKALWVAVILLAFSMNIRPNALLLGVLFFVLPNYRALKYITGTFLIAAMLFGSLLWISHGIDSHYTFSGFIAGLKNYVHLYVVGKLGVFFNNSLYGGVRTLLIAWKIELSAPTLLAINKIITGTGIFTLLLSLYIFIKNRLTPYEFTFVVMAIYTLASTVFGTYHLIPYAIFLLIPFVVKETAKLSPHHFVLIQTISVFMLVPKNYIFVDYLYPNFLSIETILNPMILLVAVVIVLTRTTQSSQT